MSTKGSDEEIKQWRDSSQRWTGVIEPIDTCGMMGFTDEEPESSFPVYNPELEFDKVGHEPCFHFRSKDGYFVQAFICDGEIGFMKTKIVPLKGE